MVRTGSAVVVGANYHRHTLSRVAGFERVLLIEPLQECCEMLEELFRNDTSRVIENVACAATVGRKPFFISNVDANGQSSSLGEVTQQACDHYSHRYDLRIHSKRYVDVVLLPDLLEKHGFSVVDYLQVDAQGWDLEILKTATEWLKAGRIKSVMAESESDGFSHYINAPDNKTRSHKRFMTSMGFTLVSQSNTVTPDLEWSL